MLTIDVQYQTDGMSAPTTRERWTLDNIAQLEACTPDMFLCRGFVAAYVYDNASGRKVAIITRKGIRIL